jgi:hypothetical protein
MATQSSTKKSAAKQQAGPVYIPPAPVQGSPAAVPQGSAQAYEQYLPIAQKFLDGTVPIPYRFDPALAYQNIITGLTALTPYESALISLPAPFDMVSMKALPAIGLAAIYAAAQVDLTSSGRIRQLQQTASALREIMLSSAVALMKTGLVPADEVRRIARGSGPIDIAQDAVDLAALFTNFSAAITGKTPITQANIDDAKSVGDQLLALLKPKNAPRKTRSEQYPEVAARDALGALMVSWHKEHMRRAGMWIWGEEVDQHVPVLHSHAGAPKKKAAAKPAPAEAAKPAAPAAAPA